MILPTKGIAPDRALVTVGAQILRQLDAPLTVSQTWSRLREWRAANHHPAPISFGWFVLSLDVLFALGVVEFRDDLLTKRRVDDAAAPQRRLS
ncbi:MULTISPECIES: ABC-three component system middle component 6 [Actinoalloteichus]|uniref:Uncharacterized protein n=1 Tax=Actinoalloteichus fjordicus TaxID=1612552 RepID=A0AAC9LBG7_9PSEU|nr:MULTISPECIES: ABC-three component system middle component 6 [Actinoalloteichus]APU13274.1 hypothetical protein UA74_06000 [Actinoalloteichus fjordicus]APU19225.1 hypothetical protein UA75_06005 [Actinoalloteichus sp. GBA129-24]